MKLSQFKFDLPSGLISLYPAENRDESRLMVIHRDSGKIEHKVFKDMVEYLDEGDVMVVNNTKVFPARLYGNKEKTGAKIEVFLLRELNKEMHLWDVLVDPARKIRVGNKLFFGEGDLVAEVIDNTTSRGRTIRFLYDGENESFYNLIDTLGETPLPRYINRPVEPEDRDRYQTIYAKVVGAVAAPTAGLHFTKQVLKSLITRSLDNKKIYKELNNVDKEKFAFIISHFFETLSNREFKTVYKFCQASRTINILKNIYNKFFNRLLNQLLSGAAILSSDVVSKSLGLPNVNSERFYREYLPSLKEDDPLPTNIKEFRDLRVNITMCFNRENRGLLNILRRK